MAIDESGGSGFELLASSLRASSADLTTYMRVLAEKLEGALPDRVRVERRRVRLLSGERTVARIDCDLGDRRYSISLQRQGLEARRATAVRGIVLKSEALSLDQWIDGLASDLGAEAETSEQSRRAVQQLLSG